MGGAANATRSTVPSASAPSGPFDEGNCVDVVDPQTRSRMMAGIRGRDTRPEMAVRRYLHAAGLRFRLHASDLPGRPDIVFPGGKLAVFVHGCFWHQHAGCRFARTPSTRPDFWRTKFAANKKRDLEVASRLEGMGWSCQVIWECEVTDDLAIDALVWRIRAHLETGR